MNSACVCVCGQFDALNKCAICGGIAMLKTQTLKQRVNVHLHLKTIVICQELWLKLHWLKFFPKAICVLSILSRGWNSLFQMRNVQKRKPGMQVRKMVSIWTDSAWCATGQLSVFSAAEHFSSYWTWSMGADGAKSQSLFRTNPISENRPWINSNPLQMKWKWLLNKKPNMITHFNSRVDRLSAAKRCSLMFSIFSFIFVVCAQWSCVQSTFNWCAYYDLILNSLLSIQFNKRLYLTAIM